MSQNILIMNMKFVVRLTIFLLAIVFSNSIKAQAPYGSAGDHTPVPFGSPETPFGYYEYLPLDFDATSGDNYPLVLFYHGYGERGNGTSDLNDILLFGPPKLINQGSHFEAIVISPQNSDANYSSSDFLSLYNYLISNYPVDINRVYVTGLSSGGGSTWRALQGHYDKIAAAIPICGSGFLNNPSDYLQQTPIWAFHSFNDTVIDVNNTITNVNRITSTSTSVMSVYPYGTSNSAASDHYTMLLDLSNQAWSAVMGAIEPTDNLAFTLYNTGGHNSWTITYNNQDVWDWMFSKSLGTLTIEDEKLVNINVFPNPTSNKLTITTKSNSNKKIELYNLLGEHIYSNLFSKKLTIDMCNYASGVYLAKISEDSIEKVVKIIVN